MLSVLIKEQGEIMSRQLPFICVPILPNQTHVQIFKNDIFAFYVSIHPYEAQKKVL